ncbi:hypothetical protein [Zhihengliuella sp.]|uniref:hypothetical protein n=1 Tax=Zhihengliuella sp. TaxID=1954483 RepID=UPI002810E625|nr:hypothetical protein [Zhihengliuella sp.]
MPANAISADLAAAYWKPTLYRGVLAAAFGLTSVFWADPPAGTLAWIFALFLVVTGVAVRRMAMLEETPSAAKGYWALVVVAWLIGAIALVFLGTASGLIWAGGLAWIVGGLLQLLAWFKLRTTFGPARDWLVPAVVEIGIGAGLFIVPGLDAHGIFGIAGGGQIVVAVFTLIAGFGLLFDARRRGGVAAADR